MILIKSMKLQWFKFVLFDSANPPPPLQVSLLQEKE